MAEKVILGLCTAGSRLKVSALSGGKFRSAQRKVFNQEKYLLAAVKKTLAGAELRGVGTVCAARGPGRFTGIRIALTLAGTLKALSGAKVYTATLFEILALQAAESAAFRKSGARRVAALLHAFKDEYFCQFFSAGRDLPRPEGEPAWLKAEELRARLAAAQEPYFAAADAEEEPGVYGLLPGGAPKAPPALSRIIPAYVIKAALAYRNPTLRPLYLKPAKYELENNVRPPAAKGPAC